MQQHLWPITATINEHGHLAIGGCDSVALAREHDTPLYLFDEVTIRANCRAYRAAFAQHFRGDSAVHYASKALLNTTVAQLVVAEGLGLDVVSGGELYVALRAGVAPECIHMHGNAKPRAELQQALNAGIGRIVVDTLDELDLLAELTTQRAVSQAIMLRLAPGIAADTHAHIATGQADSKFGLPLDALDAAAERVAHAPGLRLRGLHVHLGSQLFAFAPYEHAIGVLLDCAARLRERFGITVDEISPGGGLGVPYTAEQQPPDVDAYARAIGGALAVGCAARNLPLPRLVVEPGRSIIARAGVALYSVVARKSISTDDRRQTTDDGHRNADEHPSSFVFRSSSFVHIDGGMADNIRPALYGARYTALLANRANEPPGPPVHISGRFCESGDVLLRDAPLPPAVPGDLLAVADAGAYTLSMASSYNLVPRPAVLLLADGAARRIQRRETYADLVARDAL